MVAQSGQRLTFDPNGTADLHALELRARLDALAYQDAALADIFGPAAAYSRWLIAQQRDALTSELRRRERLYAAGANVPNPHDARHDAWLALAAQVRERADIVQVLADAGHEVYDTRGYSKRRDAREHAGPCPLCGGRDRFRVWQGRDSGCWCRRCGFTGDAIDVVRNFVAGFQDFYPAVGYLARALGLPLPDETAPLRPARPAGALRYPTRRAS